MNLTVGSVVSMTTAPASPRMYLTLLDGTGQSYGVLGFAVVVSDVEDLDVDGEVETTTVLEPVISYGSQVGPASAVLPLLDDLPMPYEVALR